MGFWDTAGDYATGGVMGGLLGMRPWDLFKPNPAEGGFKDLASMLRAQSMGQGPSVVDLQHQQALERGIAGQKSLAAGARPGQTAMAQRMASQGIGNLGAQLGSQSMLARLMEQQQAQQLYLQALMGQSQVPTMSDKLLGAAQGAGQMYMMSDQSKKKNIRSGRTAADEFLSAIKPKTYRYKDEADGAGRRLGIMAQAIEKTKLAKHAIVQTPRGKVVDTAQLAGPIAAALGRLNEKFEKMARASRAAR